MGDTDKYSILEFEQSRLVRDSLGVRLLEPGELFVDRKETSFYIRSIFTLFTFIWILVIVMNKFYKNIAAYILLIPFAIFLLGFMNAEDILDDKLEDDVFSVTFVTVGIIISMPLLTLFNKNKNNVELNHIIFLAIISILLSYFHLWCDRSRRHICKAIRTCLETFSITLYIFAIAIFFIQEQNPDSNDNKGNDLSLVNEKSPKEAN